jgi:hypothetical protein
MTRRSHPYRASMGRCSRRSAHSSWRPGGTSSQPSDSTMAISISRRPRPWEEFSSSAGQEFSQGCPSAVTETRTLCLAGPVSPVGPSTRTLALTRALTLALTLARTLSLSRARLVQGPSASLEVKWCGGPRSGRRARGATSRRLDVEARRYGRASRPPAPCAHSVRQRQLPCLSARYWVAGNARALSLFLCAFVLLFIRSLPLRHPRSCSPSRIGRRR